MVLRKIILIPFDKYTRSSLVAGIFAAHGCWTGETKKLKYDTFENRQIFWWMKGAFSVGTPCDNVTMKMFNAILPEDGFVVLKAYWKWRTAFRYLENDVVGEFFPYRLQKRIYDAAVAIRQEHVVHIDTDILVRHVFKEMKPAIESCGLQWDEQKAESVFRDGLHRFPR